MRPKPKTIYFQSSTNMITAPKWSIIYDLDDCGAAFVFNLKYDLFENISLTLAELNTKKNLGAY